MAQIILTFGLGKEKIKVVRSIAQKNRIQIKEISRKDYNQKLGALAEIQGFAKEKVIYNGPDFPLEMIVFSGIDCRSHANCKFIYIDSILFCKQKMSQFMKEHNETED